MFDLSPLFKLSQTLNVLLTVALVKAQLSEVVLYPGVDSASLVFDESEALPEHEVAVVDI